MQNLNAREKLLSRTIALAITAGASLGATAQEQGVEEVMVTGIKASLARAMDVKREASGVVDAISAEDIGKMPDANLAESLQRIPGVSIDRAGGEGSKVTVRGLAGDYNMVTLNSRQMPASTVGNGAASTSRSFDFANLASEGVSAVEVYKTGRADIASGGMGALINIVTPRPLKNPGLKATFGLKAVDDSSSETGGITPEVSGLFSNTFADDTIGIALTGSYQERDSGNRQALLRGWFTHKGNEGDWAGIPQEDQPAAGTTYSHPVDVRYVVEEARRTRANGQLTLQYRPVEQLEVTADYLYVEQQVDIANQYGGIWFTRGNNLDISWSDSNPAYPLSYSEETGRHDLDAGASFGQRESNLKSAGFNAKWQASDNYQLELDAHHSTSYAGPNGPYGTENSFDTAVFMNYQASLTFNKGFPVLNIVPLNDDGTVNNNALTPPDAVRSQLSGNTFKNATQVSSVDEIQLKNQITFDDSVVQNIKFGISASENDNSSLWIGHQQANMGSWSGVGNPGDIAAQFWPLDRWSNHFDASGANDPAFQDVFVAVDFHQLTAIGAQLYGVDTPTQASPCVRAYCAVTDPALANDGFSDQKTTEKTRTAFVQVNFAEELYNLPLNVSTGLRYEETDVQSKSLLTSYSPLITWTGGNEFALVSEGQKYLADQGDYQKFLPSIDADLGLNDDLKLRASVSKTMARPNYNDIAGGLNLNPAPRIGQGAGTSGNPDLNPLESLNSDLSLEWYYDDSSYAALSYFRKKVDNFIGYAPQLISDSGYHTLVGGARWNAALASGLQPYQADQIRDYIIAHTPAEQADSYEIKDGHTWIFALPEDPLLPFEITRPVNNKASTIDGIEIALQHSFGESGFGIFANATKVDADVAFDNRSISTQFAILGLSDSANLVLFYDKDALQARIAYNWRDDFLAGTGDAAGGNNPRYVDDYGQVDATISYQLTDNLVISLEGLNILNETTRAYGRDWHQLLNYTETGARYNLGARYTF